jgi:hypothetical protein
MELSLLTLETYSKEELIAFENRIGDLYLDNKLPFSYPKNGEEILQAFREAVFSKRPSIIIERKSRY